MPKGSAAFELTDGEIRVLWFSIPPFRKSLCNAQAVKFDRIPIPTGVIEQGTVRDGKTLIDILTSYRSEHPGTYSRAYLAVSFQQGFIGSYTLPWLSKYNRKSAIPFLVDEEISIARSDLLYDYLVTTEEKHKSLEVLLGATRRSILEQYAFIFEQAGFKVVEIDFAYSILGQALGFQADIDVLYLKEEPGSIHMILFRGEVPKNVRSLPFLLAHEEGKDWEKEWIEKWKSEIGRFLLYHRTQHSDYNLKRLVWSGGFHIKLLVQELGAENSNLMVEQAMLKGIPDSWQKLLEENKGLGETVIGYGLRILAHRPGLNLWLQPTARQKAKKTYLSIALLAALLFMAGTLIWLALCQMALPLQEEVTQLTRQGIRIEEQNRQQETLVEAWNKVGINPEEIGERLAKVQALLGTEVKIEQISFKQGSLSVRGSAEDSKSIQGMIQTLRALGWEDPSLAGYKLTALNIVEFTLSTKRDSILFQDSDLLE